MSLSQDLKTFFPKYKHSYNQGSTTILEGDAKATIKKLTFTNSDFHFVDTEMIKDCSSIFKSGSKNNSSTHEIFFKDCDGIVLFEDGGKKYFFLAELKSSFATGELYKAMHQIISSYIKSNMLMNLLATYSREDYIFEAFITSHPPKKDYLRDLYKAKQSSKYKNEAEFAAELYKGKEIKIKACECEKLEDFNFGDKCLFSSLRFHFVEVPVGTDSITVDVNRYIYPILKPYQKNIGKGP